MFQKIKNWQLLISNILMKIQRSYDEHRLLNMVISNAFSTSLAAFCWIRVIAYSMKIASHGNMRGPLLVNPNSSSLDWIALSKNFTVKVIQGDHKAFFVSGVHNKVTFLYCRWFAAVVWIYTANGLWQGDPFFP